jgi:hypothetical protein
MFRILENGVQTGRSYKSLTAAEAAVQRKYGAAMNGTGPGRVDIVDERDHIIRVFYVQ